MDDLEYKTTQNLIEEKARAISKLNLIGFLERIEFTEMISFSAGTVSQMEAHRKLHSLKRLTIIFIKAQQEIHNQLQEIKDANEDKA